MTMDVHISHGSARVSFISAIPVPVCWFAFQYRYYILKDNSKQNILKHALDDYGTDSNGHFFVVWLRRHFVAVTLAQDGAGVSTWASLRTVALLGCLTNVAPDQYLSTPSPREGLRRHG